METGIPEQAMNRILRVFKKYPEISEAVLYGSRAIGSHKNGSDIDLSLKGTNLDFKILNQIEEELDELLLPWMIDLNLYERIGNKELLEHIDSHGIQIYLARPEK